MTHTVLIPVFNTPAPHLIEAVNSMLYQKRVVTKVLIIDDGSTDPGTREAIELLELHDRVDALRLGKNEGTPTALNKAHEIVKTDYSIIMGSDDISHLSRLELQLEYMKQHPETDVLGTGLWAFKDSGSTLFRSKWFEFVHPEKPLPRVNGTHNMYFIVNHGTVIYRNKAVNDVGGYNPLYKRGQDVELWKRMWENKAVFRNLPNILYAFRRVVK